MKATPLYGKRAFFVLSLKAIVIADLHLGIEYELSLGGAHIPSQTTVLLQRCQELGREKHADTFILLGDVKHIIAPLGEKKDYVDALRKERRELNFFLSMLSQEFDVWIVKGNHDGGLKRKEENITIYESKGISKGGIGFAHGHAWPSKEVMETDVLITAHTHPVICLFDSFGYAITKPCWVRGACIDDNIRKKYGITRKKMEVIIMPAFNPLCGGIAVNREGALGPIGKILDVENARIYLLDGTYLGHVKNIKNL